MKRFTVKKDSRNFGVNAKWYNHENVERVEAENPTNYCGGRMWPAAYFVALEEWQTDEMREFNPSRWVAIGFAGPFATESEANDWGMAYIECPF